MNYTIRGKEFNVIEREVWSLAERNLWEPDTFDVLDKYIVPGKIFIDIGAWCGILSLYAGKLGAEVHAIDPDPVAFQELQANIIGSDVRTYNVAISDKDGVALLCNSSKFGNSESSFIWRHDIKESQQVLCYTLESWIAGMNAKRVCLIKMDVEGAEVMILKQAAGWLAKHKPPMWISFHPGYFENLSKDIQIIIDSLFDIYDCNTDYEDFAEILFDPNAFHSFLFLPQ